MKKEIRDYQRGYKKGLKEGRFIKKIEIDDIIKRLKKIRGEKILK